MSQITMAAGTQPIFLFPGTSRGFYFNTATPEAAITANKGSLCIDTATGFLYTKSTDSANTGWKLVTQAA